MPENHPPLTVGYLKDWIKQNRISDDHVLTDQDGRAIRGLGESTFWSRADGEIPALMLRRTWG